MKCLTDKPQISRCSGLRALIMFNYMTHLELTTGKYDKACLLDYLRIPRERGYNSTRLKSLLKELPLCPYDYCVNDIPCLKPIGNDEPYVTRALQDFFQMESYAKWIPLV